MSEELEQLLNDDKPLDEAALSNLSTEELSEFRKKETERIVALRQERRRVSDKAKDEEKGFETRFREEQLSKARLAFYAKFPNLTEEQKAKVEEAFKRIDSGALDATIILADFRKAYASVNADTLIEAQEERIEFRKNADELNQENATPSGSGEGSQPPKKYSPEVMELVKQSRAEGALLTPEEAEKYLSQGLKRVYK